MGPTIAGDEAICSVAFPVHQAHYRSCDGAGDGTAENIACVVGSYVNARDDHQQRGGQEAEPTAAHAMQQESRCDREGRGRVI
jgi:hypothetical protein